jgi:hypothetical protein
VYAILAGVIYVLVAVLLGPRGLAIGLMTGLRAAVMIVVLVGLLAGLQAGRYATASLLFAFTKTFAPRPVRFLEWARNAGLLRVTGIAYQYRHDSYQQWLAWGHIPLQCHPGTTVGATAHRAPPGWYPDPSGAPGQRYFDGRDWTEHRAHPFPPLAPGRCEPSTSESSWTARQHGPPR